MDDSEPIIWMRPEFSGHGKRPSYTREQIAKVAVTIADADGIDAVSMRRVANDIGAGTMSLYRYVRNKEELFALMVDAVCAPGAPPGEPRQDWLDLLRDYGHGVRALVLAHPWFPVLQAGIPAAGPNMVRGMEYLLSAVDGPGRDIDEVLEIVNTVMTFAMGFVQDELAEARALLRSGLDREQWMRRQAPYLRSLIDSGDYPYLRRLIVDAKIPHSDREANFERALDRLITGIAATTDQAPPAVNTP